MKVFREEQPFVRPALPTQPSRAPSTWAARAAREASVQLSELYFVWLAMLVAAILGRQHLPARFSYDGQYIQQVAQNAHVPPPDPSYAIVAAVFRALQLENAPTLIAILGVTFIGLSIFAALRVNPHARISVSVAYVCFASMLLGSVYLSWYGKDVFVLLITFPVIHYLRTGSRQALFACIAPIALYAATFRSYWALIGILFLVFRQVGLKRNSAEFRSVVVRLFVASQVAILLFCVIHQLALGTPADLSRLEVNALRNGSPDAASAIHPFVSDVSPLGAYVNIALTQLSFIVPWPLLTTGVAIHLVYFAFIVALWLVAGIPIAQRWGRVPPDKRALLVAGVSFLWAVLTTLAIFEPDYGSFLRHISPVLPVLLAVQVMTAKPRPGSPGHVSAGAAGEHPALAMTARPETDSRSVV